MAFSSIANEIKKRIPEHVLKKMCIKYQKLDDRSSIQSLSQMSESIKMLCSVCDAFKCGASTAEEKKVEECSFWHRVPDAYGCVEPSHRKCQKFNHFWHI